MELMSGFRVVATNSSKVFVVWEDDTRGNNEIYLAFPPLEIRLIRFRPGEGHGEVLFRPADFGDKRGDLVKVFFESDGFARRIHGVCQGAAVGASRTDITN